MKNEEDTLSDEYPEALIKSGIRGEFSNRKRAKNKALFFRLVDNALDFLARSIADFEQSPKYSVINFYTAAELFVKARLMREHWSLVVTKRNEPDWEKFLSGDFQSVTLDEAATRLEKVVQSGLTDQELTAFRAVRAHRNKVVHFFHEAHTTKANEELRSVIATEQLKAWYFLHKVISVRWKSIFDPWSKKISELDLELRKHQAFLQVIFDNVQTEITRLQKNGLTIESCPSCGFISRPRDSEANYIQECTCLVCGLSEKLLTIECPDCDSKVTFINEGFSICESCGKSFEPEDVVNAIIDDAAAHIAKMDGDDSWDLGNCSDCDGYHTVVRVDDTHYCASCFGEFESLETCGAMNPILETWNSVTRPAVIVVMGKPVGTEMIKTC